MSPAAQGAADVAKDMEKLMEDGYMVLEGVLSAENADALREHVLTTSDEAQKLGRNDLFGNIHENVRRTDLKLDLCAPVVEAVNNFGNRCGALLEGVCGGNVKMVELAAITSNKGAAAQPVHADTMHGITRFLQSDIAYHPETRERTASDSEDEDADEDVGKIIRAVASDTALIFTALVALQDIEADMGPTLVWPRTNTVDHHAKLWDKSGKLLVDDADEVLDVEHKKMTLRKGDLVLYDSRTIHCGGANESEKRRSVLCISCMGPGIRPDGTTWSMLPSLRNQIKLSKLPMTKITAPTNTAASDEVALPARVVKEKGDDDKAPVADGANEPKAILPLDQWEAAVLCTLCRRWRACTAEEAPRLTALEHGFQCPMLKHSCMQEQGYTDAEIDALF
eukprot:TRINITY_DN31468_c0_g1_i1.p1 TRINITY_DN31468_c0_g1~~TRINITY_DN31468_c0_g1_i1.p1  ORF type:complete len:395 (-),score=54.74 TRINITY_DN31468_c0_g1_i1:244-1428(-)